MPNWGDKTVVQTTSDYVLLSADEIVEVDASSGPISITLHSAVGTNQKTVVVYRVDTTSNTVMLKSADDTFRSGLSAVLRHDKSMITLSVQDDVWKTVSQHGILYEQKTFVPVDSNATKGPLRSRLVKINSSFQITFMVPQDYVSFLSINLIGWYDVDVSTGDLDVTASFASVGQGYDENSLAFDKLFGPVLGDEIFSVDVKEGFDGTLKGDLCGLNVTNRSSADLRWAGVEIYYLSNDQV